MKGNISGWTMSVHNSLKMNALKSMKLKKLNLLLMCPHLTDFVLPKAGEIKVEKL